MRPSDVSSVVLFRSAANRLSFAVHLALLRHPGMGLAQMEEPVDAVVGLAGQLKIPAADYAVLGNETVMADERLLGVRQQKQRVPLRFESATIVPAWSPPAFGSKVVI